MHRTRLYRDGQLVAEDFPVAEISDHLADPACTVWFDLCEPGPEDLAAISEELGLHRLAVEDAVNEHQRPKLDRYQSHLFMTGYQVRREDGTGRVAVSEIDAFITKHALVTVRKDRGFDIQHVVDRWDESADLARYGVAFLLHGLVDYLVDTYFEAVQALDEEVESLEDELFTEKPRDLAPQRRIFELRRSLVTLRKVVLPMREVINSLMRRDLHVVEEAMGPYFQDVYDHVLRAADWTDSLRELVTNVFETRLAIRGNRLNVVMKQVTSWAAIIAIPTAITGFYGQNVPYPGFGTHAGFWTSTAIIVGLSGGLYAMFRWRDWL
jgi:magnesium transporter